MEELAVKNMEDVPKPLVEVDMKPFELDIYLIFCVLLFSSLFSFFMLGNEEETSETNSKSSAMGFSPKSSYAKLPKHETVSNVYLKLWILFLYNWRFLNALSSFNGSTVFISLLDAYNSSSFYNFINGFKSYTLLKLTFSDTSVLSWLIGCKWISEFFDKLRSSMLYSSKILKSSVSSNYFNPIEFKKSVLIFSTRFLLSQNIAELMISFRLTFYMVCFYLVMRTLSLPRMKLNILAGSLFINCLDYYLRGKFGKGL